MSRRDEIRAALFNRKLQKFPVDWEIAGLEQYTGELSAIELTGTQISLSNKLAKDMDGNTDAVLAQAAVVCLGLLIEETKERVFDDKEIDFIAKMGLSVLKPIGDLIGQLSGLDPAGFEETKKNYARRHAKSFSSSSTANSEQQQQG